jgi:hypothetical protein
MIYIIYELEQYLFGLCLYAIWIIIKLIFRATVYSPLLITGYATATKILDRNDHALAWILVILLSASMMYQLVYLIKGILITMKARRNYFWIFLFMVCVGFTCVFPAWLFMVAVKGIIITLSKENMGIISGMIAVVFGLYIYNRYLFLTDVAPSVAYSAYQLGNWIALKLPDTL